MIIAIDGPAASGKSTVARMVARRIGVPYVNSGSFYRAITLAVLEEGYDPARPEDVVAAAAKARIALRRGEVYLGERNVDGELHSDAVDRWVASHSAIPEVRAIVNEQLRRAVAGLDAVIDGRDIGTVVFPDAEAKIYLDASIHVRALRRLKQGVSSLSLEEIERSIVERDRIDRTKPQGSLRKSEDASFLDTSDLTIEEVCEKVIGKIRKTT